MNKIKLYCNNGLFLWETGDSCKVKTLTSVKDESDLHETMIPEGTLLDVEYCDQSLYGTFMIVNYKGDEFWIKPKYVEMVRW